MWACGTRERVPALQSAEHVSPRDLCWWAWTTSKGVPQTHSRYVPAGTRRGIARVPSRACALKQASAATRDEASPRFVGGASASPAEYARPRPEVCGQQLALPHVGTVLCQCCPVLVVKRGRLGGSILAGSSERNSCESSGTARPAKPRREGPRRPGPSPRCRSSLHPAPHSHLALSLPLLVSPPPAQQPPPQQPPADPRRAAGQRLRSTRWPGCRRSTLRLGRGGGAVGLLLPRRRVCSSSRVTYISFFFRFFMLTTLVI